MKLPNADKIKHIIRLAEGRAKLIVRVRCPFCRTKNSLLLIGSTDKYECQVCMQHGRLDDLIVYFEDEFEWKHRKTMRLMSERSAVERLGCEHGRAADETLSATGIQDRNQDRLKAGAAGESSLLGREGDRHAGR